MKIKDLWSGFGEDDENPGHNPSFIRLVQIMRDDEEFRRLVYQVIQRPTEDRNRLIDLLLVNMTRNKAPEEHKDVFRLLRDDDICRKVVELQ